MLNKIVLTIIFYITCCISSAVYSLEDPTKPPSYLAKSTINVENTDNKKNIKYVLNAIKISSESRSAIINGDKYVIGQTIGENRVKSISSTNVLLTSGTVLSLFDNKSNNIAKKGY